MGRLTRPNSDLPLCSIKFADGKILFSFRDIQTIAEIGGSYFC